MAWLIGIISIILLICFWRIFLPIALILGAATGLFFSYDYLKTEKRLKAEKETAAALERKIWLAQIDEKTNGEGWEIYYQPDPASNKMIARAVVAQSNDGLCTVSVQKRVNGAELTELKCPDVTISPYEKIEVKFEMDEVSKEMRLEKYTDSSDVYIPSDQYQFDRSLQYDEFINKLIISKAFAIHIPSEPTFWTRFELNDGNAILQLGKEKPKKAQNNEINNQATKAEETSKPPQALPWMNEQYQPLNVSKTITSSFDCTSAKSQVELLICSDQELASLDKTMADQYQALIKKMPKKQEVLELQRQFLKLRTELCIEPTPKNIQRSSVGCLKDLYRARIKELNIESQT